MSKRLTPYEKVDNFIVREHDKQVDRWNAGLDNNVFEWEDFINHWNLIDNVASLKKDNAELRVYNDKLLEENKKLKDKNQKQENALIEIVTIMDTWSTSGLVADEIALNQIGDILKEMKQNDTK